MPKKVAISTEVYCTLQVEGLHHWPECPYAEVSYLQSLHRHLFHIKAYKKVTHDNRDVEFIVLKHRIEEYLYETYLNDFLNVLDFKNMSCEMIAKKLISKFDLSRCEVSEDGENGAIVTVEGEVKTHKLHDGSDNISEEEKSENA